MPTLHSFHTELKERTANPFIVSFIFSWLVINWPIPIGLIWYSISDVRLDGYISFADMITQNLSIWKMVWQPLLSATIFTLLYPILRSMVMAFNLWIQAQSSNWHRQIATNGSISVEKYFDLRDKYYNSLKKFEEIARAESEYINKYDIEMERHVHARREATEAQHQINDWNTKSKLNYFNGEFDMIFQFDRKKQQKKATIENGKIFILGTDMENTQVFEIMSSAYNYGSGEFILVIRCLVSGFTTSFPCVLRNISSEGKTFKCYDKDNPLQELSKR